MTSNPNLDSTEPQPTGDVTAPTADATGHNNAAGVRPWLVGAAIVAAAGVGSFAATTVVGAQDSSTTTTADSSATEPGPTDSGAKAECGPPEGARPSGGRGGVHGTVSAVDSTSITVTTDDESTTVSIDAETTVREATELALSDLAVGDTVRVHGERSEDGSAITASQVRVGDSTTPKPNSDANSSSESNSAKSPRGAATIASVTDSGFTMTTEDGDTVTVTVNDETTIVSVAQVEVSAIEVGDTVRIAVPRSEDDTAAAASSIVIGDAELGGRDFGGRGPGGHRGPGGRGDQRAPAEPSTDEAEQD